MIKIFHLSSHARGGETLALKLLNAHSLIHVPIQITAAESREARALVDWIKADEPQELPLDHPYADSHRLTERHILLVKQGVWFPINFDGFGLIRHPLSFVHSLLEYNQREGLRWGFTERIRFWNTFKRIHSWTRGMNPIDTRSLHEIRDVVELLCHFYNIRVQWILTSNKTVFRYEDLVRQPEYTLSRMCDKLSVEFEKRMVLAHNAYTQERHGHGLTDLTRPIDTKSLDKWRLMPLCTQEKILSFTELIRQKAGYDTTP